MSNKPGQALEVKDQLHNTLRTALYHSFLEAGYENDQSYFLADIAIGPVRTALQEAQKAYQLHVEAVAHSLDVLGSIIR